MSIIVWLLVGLIAGWIANMIMSSGAGGLLADIVIGIVGAIVGGFVASLLFGGDFINGFNIQTILVSVLGALLVIAAYRAISHQAVRQ